MELGLADTSALVAGSSRGIGLAVAHAFLAEGASVTLTGRAKSGLDDALASLRDDRRTFAFQGDLTDPAEIERALDASAERFGRLDHVVANIGNGALRSGWDIEPGEWASALRENLLGSAVLASAALRRFAGQGRGTLTFVSSIAGVESTGAPAHYAAAKAALLSLTKSLARLAGESGVRVNAVAPGNVLFPGGSWDRKLTDRREEIQRYIETEVALQRFGNPEEIADAVLFLASERASFITGACLVVDGGQTRSWA